MKKKVLLASAIAIVAILVGLVIATPKVALDPPLPSPNGYDDFVRAGKLINPSPPDWWSMSGDELHEALRELTATNQAGLDLVRTGLLKKCCVVPYEMNATNGTHLDALARSKALAQAFAAASRLALIEGHTNDAAALAVECIRFGNESARGGVLIDGLVGLAIKTIGLGSLRSARDGMDADAARKAISELDEIAARGESADVVLKRERQWARRGRFGPSSFFTQLLSPLLNRKALAAGRQTFIKRETDIHRMKIKLAAHAYELHHGKPPAAASDLVPQYLKAIPLDPATGQELPLN